ncbi:MAG: hypothetical protein RRY20_05160 [Bilophila sp.]
MLGLWLVLIVVASAVVGQATRTESSGNLLAFLFANAVPAPPLPRVAPLSVQPAPPAPVVAQEQVTPAPLAPPAPEPQWRPLPRGWGKGSGAIETPIIDLLPDGPVQVRFPYTGNPGETTAFRSGNTSLSVDLHGTWKNTALLDKRFTGNQVLERLQIAQHDGYVQDTATGRNQLFSYRNPHRVLTPEGALRCRESVFWNASEQPSLPRTAGIWTTRKMSLLPWWRILPTS